MTDAQKSWATTRFPLLAEWGAALTTPSEARDAQYLAALPVLICGGLILLALSGFALAIHYNPADAFASLKFIDREVNNGWLVHGFHESGASLLLGAAYLFIFRNLLIRTYRAPGELAWLLGVLVFAALLGAGYLGYLLTDGAVAHWSLAEATHSLGGGIPGALQNWIFGGPAGADTLGRLVVIHVTLALLIFGLLAAYFSAAKAATPVPANAVALHPYYTAQYFVAFGSCGLILALLVFFAPHLGENVLNAAPADPLLVPPAITPPWFLRPISALNGLWGPFAVLAGFAVLFALPWLDRSNPAKPPGWVLKFFVWVLGLDVIGLAIAAFSASPLGPTLTTLFAVWYFVHFLVLTPLITLLEAA